MKSWNYDNVWKCVPPYWEMCMWKWKAKNENSKWIRSTAAKKKNIFGQKHSNFTSVGMWIHFQYKCLRLVCCISWLLCVMMCSLTLWHWKRSMLHLKMSLLVLPSIQNHTVCVLLHLHNERSLKRKPEQILPDGSKKIFLIWSGDKWSESNRILYPCYLYYHWNAIL